MADTTYTIFVINPGSTSTKLAFYDGSLSADESVEPVERSVESVPCTAESDMRQDLENRGAIVQEYASSTETIDIVAARGGLVAPVTSGTFRVNERMIDDLISCRYGRHASNLGAPLAATIAQRYGCPAIIADPVGVDEFPGIARFSGWKEIERRSFSHALNLRAGARRAAAQIGVEFERGRFIGIHLGGGISVAAIDGGKIIDVNNSNEDGPFTPQRTGGLPVLQLVDLCFSGKHADAEEVKRQLVTVGGLVSYLGTDDVREILDRIESGDADAKLVVDAMLYQIAKEAGAMASVLEGKIHGVFLTGGFARQPISMWLCQRLGWLGRVIVYPGEGEMEALAQAGLRVLQGGETVRDYTGLVPR